MLKVLLLQDTNYSHFLRIHWEDVSENREILFLDPPREYDVQCYQNEKFKQIFAPYISDQDREKFLFEYVDFIGQLSQQFHDRLWWATDLSSKNRFNSNLPLYLQHIIAIRKLLSTRIPVAEGKESVLVIAGVPWQMMADLQQYLNQQDVKCLAFKKMFQNRALLCLTFVRRTLALLRQYCVTVYRSIRAKQVLGNFLQKQFAISSKCTLIKTFIYDHSFVKQGEYQDVFFCDLVSDLQKKGPVVIFANILGNFEYCLKKIRDMKDVTIIPMEYLSDPLTILRAHWQAWTYRIKIKKHMLFDGIPILSTVNNELLSTFCRIRPYQLLHYDYLSQLLKQISVDRFITSFENNPWEKMCFLALRQFSPQTAIIGYQHTVVPQASVNMFISKLEKSIIPHPDRLLTVGEEPSRIIQKYSSANSFPVQSSCALRFKYLFNLKTQPRRNTKTILLGLEGIFDVYHMVNYVMRYLSPDSGYNVILRTHPVLSLKDFEHKLKFPIREFKNFTVSRGLSLKDDIERSDAAIYWGSTVGLEALWVGRPVIHYDNGFILSYDPLFQCQDLKWVVKESDSLLDVLNHIYSMPEQDFVFQQQTARKYLENYFHPIEPKALNLFALRP